MSEKRESLPMQQEDYTDLQDYIKAHPLKSNLFSKFKGAIFVPYWYAK
jgi:hypothetical protein